MRVLQSHMRNRGSALPTSEDTCKTNNSPGSKPDFEKCYQQIENHMIPRGLKAPCFLSFLLLLGLLPAPSQTPCKSLSTS